MASVKKLNVGMIGYKFMGRAHSNAWRQASRFFNLPALPVMHTICGRNKVAVQEAADKLGWQHINTDWHSVINDADIDIIDITTTNNTHAEIAIAALKAGKAVLCEKPLALSARDARTMRDAAKKSGVVNMVCHNYRRIPAIAFAQQLIESGKLGKIFHLRARYLQDWITDPNTPLNWRLQADVAGSGTHGDINAHIIDLGRYLVGEIAEVTALMETFIKERPLASSADGLNIKGQTTTTGKTGKVTVDDAVLTIGRFANGALLNLEATRFAYGRKNGIQLEVNGSKGSLFFDFEDMNRLKYYNAEDPEGLRGFRDIIVNEGVHPYAAAWWPPGHIIGYEHTFVHTIADFVSAFVKGKSVQPTFEDGYRNQVVLDAISASAKSGRWAKVKL